MLGVGRCLCMGALIMLGLGPWARAQNPLSLEEAVKSALENNFGIQIVRMQEQLTANNNHWGTAGRYPTVNFNVNGNGSYTDNPASFAPIRLTGSLGPSLNWVLFDGYRVRATKGRLDLLEEQAGGNANLVIENTLQAVILAYYQILLAKEQSAVLAEVLKNSKDRLAYEAYRRDLGTGSSFELLQFQTAVTTDSANWLTQQLNLRNLRKNLNLLMGEKVEMEFELTEGLQEVFPSFSLADLQEKMLDDNTSVKNQFVQNQIFRKEVEIAQASLYPRLSLNGGANYILGSITRADGQRLSVGAFEYSAGLSLSFTLYNGGNVKRQIENARIQERIGDLQLRDLQQSLVRDLSVMYNDYSLRRDLLKLQEESVTYAEDNLSQAAERFQNGLINSFDYRNIQLQYLNAQFGRLQALRQLKESETELIRLTGGLVR